MDDPRSPAYRIEKLLSIRKLFESLPPEVILEGLMIWTAIVECDTVAGMDCKSCPIREVCPRVPRSQRQGTSPSGRVWREGQGNALRVIG
jgi:hypothetical protein